MVYFAITPQLRNFTPPFGDAGAFFPSGVFGAPSFGFLLAVRALRNWGLQQSQRGFYHLRLVSICFKDTSHSDDIYDRYMMIYDGMFFGILKYYGCQFFCVHQFTGKWFLKVVAMRLQFHWTGIQPVRGILNNDWYRPLLVDLKMFDDGAGDGFQLSMESKQRRE